MRMAGPWSRVQTLEARPYSTPLAQAGAFSSPSKRWTVTTGPKISLLDHFVVLLQAGDHGGLVG